MISSARMYNAKKKLKSSYNKIKAPFSRS